jgi:membrane-bound ClpP family serine protease
VLFFELLASASLLSIILFFLGVGLVVVEMFEPGFGFFGITGVISLIICIFVTAQSVSEGIVLTIFFFVILLILLGIFLTLLSKGKLPKRLILHEAETLEQGFAGTEDLRYLMGKAGTVVKICRPVGNVDFDGAMLEVISQGEFIETGTEVEVIEIEGNRVVVKAKQKDNA